MAGVVIGGGGVVVGLAAEVAGFAGDFDEGLEGFGLDGLGALHFVNVVLDPFLGVGQGLHRGDEEDGGDDGSEDGDGDEKGVEVDAAVTSSP